MAAGRVPDDDLVRADLFRRFGFYPTESSEHHAEYNPWFIPKGQVEAFHVPLGEYLSRVANNLDEYAETKRRLDAGEPFEIERSGEYAAVIINAIATGEPARIVANVMNFGPAGPAAGATLIANLAADACVEVPALVDALGVQPTPVGALPPHCAAYTRPAVDCQELTVRAALDEDRDLVYHAVHDRPHRPGPPDARRGLEADRRPDRGRGGVAPRVARRVGPGLALVSRRRRTPMFASKGTRLRGLAVTAAAVALLAGACGGTTTPTTGPTTAPRPPAAPATPASRAPTPATRVRPSRSSTRSGATRPRSTARRRSSRAFTAANPNIKVDVTVADWDAYWDKLQTGLAGGAAPDVFAMDGPLGPDYQSRDVLLDLTPYIEAESYDLGQLDDNAVKDFTTKDGVVFGLPRDLNVIALYYNKDMFDAAGIAYPDDTWTWDKLVEVGKQLTKDTDGDGTIDQWGVYTETTDMENAWSSFVWQAGGDILTEDGTKSALDKPEIGRPASSSCRT